MEFRPGRGVLRVSIDFVRQDFMVDPGALGALASADRDAQLLDLPLKEALARLVTEFETRYCVRLMALEENNLPRAAERAGYTIKGFRDILLRLRLRQRAPAP